MSRSASARRWRAVPPSAARPGVPRSTAFAALRAGESQAVVLLGEPGAGKTALLKDLAERASGFRVVNISGVQSEMELAFAALHQLCAPLLGRLDAIPHRRLSRCAPRSA